MRIRLAFTLDIGRHRSPAPAPSYDDDFEHRDTDTLTEATHGGDESRHRMGFALSDLDPEFRGV